MPKVAQGELKRTAEGFAARITLKGRERETFPLTACSTEPEARDRMRLLAAMARRFRKARVIVEYDGDQHRTDRAQFVKDIQRTTRLAAAGYLVLRFTGADLITRPRWIVETVAAALRARA